MNFNEIGNFIRHFAELNDFEDNGYIVILDEIPSSRFYQITIEDRIYNKKISYVIDQCWTDEHVARGIVDTFHEIEHKRKECVEKDILNKKIEIPGYKIGLRPFNDVNELNVASMYPVGKRKEYHTMYKNGNYIKAVFHEIPAIKEVIFNDPATIVIWKDGTKTVVKRQKGDKKFDKEKGLAMAIVKRMSGNKGKYNDIFKKWGAV